MGKSHRLLRDHAHASRQIVVLQNSRRRQHGRSAGGARSYERQRRIGGADNHWFEQISRRNGHRVITLAQFALLFISSAAENPAVTQQIGINGVVQMAQGLFDAGFDNWQTAVPGLRAGDGNRLAAHQTQAGNQDDPQHVAAHYRPREHKSGQA